jgi:hypothetical protein
VYQRLDLVAGQRAAPRQPGRDVAQRSRVQRQQAPHARPQRGLVVVLLQQFRSA